MYGQHVPWRSLTMKESLFGLLDLQDIDSEIDKLHSDKESYPKRIEELKALMDELTSGRSEREKELEEQRANYRHFSQQLQAAKENLDKHQARLAEITTNRQYEALQQEILTLKNSIDEYEVEALSADEKAGELEVALKETEEADAEKIKECEEEIADLETKIAEVDTVVAGVAKRREEATGDVQKRLLNLYERMRRRRSVAAVRVIRGACSGCWRSLPPQRINELKISRQIITCEGCGRILVWDDRSEDSEQ